MQAARDSHSALEHFFGILHPIRFSMPLEAGKVYGIALSCDCILRFKLRLYARLWRRLRKTDWMQYP
jgi:hypothetical protein